MRYLVIQILRLLAIKQPKYNEICCDISSKLLQHKTTTNGKSIFYKIGIYLCNKINNSYYDVTIQ